MPNRGGYGAYYRGGGGGGDDPLAAALSSLHGQWKEQGDRRAEREAQRVAQERAERAQQMEEARFAEAQRQAVAQELRYTQDRTDRLAREDEVRTEKRWAALMDQGIFAMPSLTGGPGVTMMRGPSKQEREDRSAIARQVEVAKLLQGLNDEALLGEMRGRAVALGIGGADKMSTGELAERVAQANDERKHRQRLAEINAQRAGIGMGAVGRAVPSSVALGLGAGESVDLTAADALAKIEAAEKAGVNVSGPAMGFAAPLLEKFGMADVRGTSARAALSNVSSEIMKQRSGGAITPQEFERLAPFLPDKYDNEATAKQKLTDLRGYLLRTRDAQLGALDDAGYNTSRFRSRQAGTGSALDELDSLGVKR